MLYQEHAQGGGIDVNVVREPNDGYWDNVWLKKALARRLLERPADRRLDADHGLCQGAAWNETHWENPHFNELLVAARGETDDKKRAPMYAEIAAARP